MKYFDFSRLRGFFDKIRLKLFYNTVYYVNSPQTLPPPLKKAEEEKYIAEFMNGSDRAREKLIVHNLRLVVYIAKKFENSGVNIEDLVSIGTIGLIKSINTFRPDKNIKLATYSSRCIENEILMHLRKVNQQKSDISLDEPLNVDWDGNELLLSDVLGSDGLEINYNVEDEDEKRILLLCMESLSERERLIMNMRFGLGGQKEHTQKEVADILGISQSYISRLEKRIILRLKKDIEKITVEN
ncbi:MAG: RNA polymerase sporulation sigma factor SigE [Oscillospiraceae bacterium]|nr:RNA polymerase sporulation sigma factor SigE [Oscillospiraceae bacterium]MDD7471174.1 RNA polymerase sporulation sigma factor SigE [Oscillospiraceae bacterium]MDY2678663.1 RNA polymerase sporulation sigma factor SigE [Oscillospiraceae bacterium]